ncbi:MAG TPA: Rne/Rng family ribonuclease [Candidatus Acidoferrales bacterium]|nr:Rne/Rng family ribonuclease [Candidatus Acidoferrales bacterium]
MAKEMVVCANPHETRVAILEDGQLCEIYVEREKEFALVGSIYKGRVTRVLPGMQSSFVDIGLDSDAFLYVTDFLQDVEEFDTVVHTVEEKIHKMEDQGGQAFGGTGAPGQGAIEPIDVEPLPGETIHPGNTGGESSQPAMSATGREQHGYHGRPFGRGGRSRDDRGGYGRGGRDRGRGGRGRDGRYGGRDRGRHGRELPSSKYASHRPYEPSEAGPTEPFEAVLLPGESLSVLKASPITPVTSAEPIAETSGEAKPEMEFGNAIPENDGAPEVTPTAEENAQETGAPEASAQEAGAHATTPQEAAEPFPPGYSRGGHGDRGGRYGRDRGRDRHGRGRREFGRRQEEPSQGWATALEPLPGESLAKAKSQETTASAGESHVAFVSEAQETHVHEKEIHEDEIVEGDKDPAAVIAHEETTHFVEPDEVPHAAELSEEEAAALAEQVAEAQQEEAERNAEEARAAEAQEAAENEDGQEAGFEENGVQAAAEMTEIDEGASDAERDAIEDEDAIGEAGEVEEDEEIPSGVSEADAEAIAEAIELGEQAAEQGAEIAAKEDEEQPQPMQARVRGDFRARMQRPMRRGGRDRGRGRKPFRGHGGHHRGQPRRTQLISDLLKAGQEIIVQIAKEPLGKKGARITSHIALPGRFLVYMPTLDHTGVSRKIASAEERSRLRHLVTEAKGAAGGGFIVRTAAASAAPEEVRADVEFLTKTWAEIKERGEQRKAPSLLHRDLNLVERILRDYLSSDYTAIWVDSEEEYTKVLEFVSRFQPTLANRVKLFTKSTPIFEEFGIQQEIDKGLRPKVWLKSGGYIVINHTEALVAIDVNTGKFVGRGSNRLEDTIVKTNIEAVKEIVRQIRLRDLGGIIIIDFIDMEERRNREKVMAALEDALKSDRAPSKVLRFNEFGLVAITRKRTKQALERTLCQPCPYCTGSGMVKSIPTLCYEIQSEARKMAPELDSASLTLRVHPEIAKALKTRESAMMDELEQLTRKSIIIQADPTLHWEQYDIY